MVLFKDINVYIQLYNDNVLVKQTDKHSENKAQSYQAAKSLHWPPLQWAGIPVIPHILLCVYTHSSVGNITAAPLNTMLVFTVNAFILV